MKYVIDKIREDYARENNNRIEDIDGWSDDWLNIPDFSTDGYGGGNCIFISAPTGSGKTYFILNIWLKYIAEKNMKLLYLVNRSILKAQLKKELLDTSPKISSCIDVELYQSIEHELKMCEKVTDEHKQREHNTGYSVLQKYSEYACVVCDECHYFLTDSNYNTDTAFSFRWVQDNFADKTRIFMSATIGDIMLYIKAYDKCRMDKEEMYKYYLPDFESVNKEDALVEETRNEFRKKGSRYCSYRIYEIDRNYDYIDSNIIYNIDTIAEIINDEGKKEKWLIFVDNIQTGKELSQKIKDNNNVVFVSSQNKQDEDVSETLDEIKYYEKTKSKRIVIATSVMDNGINIKDMELKNIVLMADTETEFIQMLGRKREDKNKNNLKLYIYQYNREHFEDRLRQTDKTLEIAASYLKYLSSCQRDYGSEYEEELIINRRHIKLMREIFDNKISMKHVRSLFNVYRGLLHLNLLAYQNLKNLKEYYESVIAEFDEEEDDTKREDCFVTMQLGWLGIERKKADNIIKKSKVTKIDKCREKIIAAFENKCNIPMSVEEAKGFQNTIRGDLVVLVDTTKDIERYHTVREQVGKSRCLISRPTMNYLNQNCGLRYKIIVEGKKEKRRYIIKKED